jgi:hypothetical protein
VEKEVGECVFLKREIILLHLPYEKHTQKRMCKNIKFQNKKKASERDRSEFLHQQSEREQKQIGRLNYVKNANLFTSFFHIVNHYLSSIMLNGMESSDRE